MKRRSLDRDGSSNAPLIKRAKTDWYRPNERENRGIGGRGREYRYGRRGNCLGYRLKPARFYQDPSVEAIFQGLGGISIQNFDFALNEDEMKDFLLNLNKIFMSPFKYCVKDVLLWLKRSKFFEQENTVEFFENVLCDSDNSKNFPLSPILNVARTYCSFCKEFDAASGILKLFLCHIENHQVPYDGVINEEQNMDLKINKSPFEFDLDDVFPSDITCLYRKSNIPTREVEEPFNDRQQFMERIYTLHKEDFIRPIVRGLCRFREYLKNCRDIEKFRHDDIRAYQNVYVIQSSQNLDSGLVWETQLDISQPLVRNIIHRSRKLLQVGTLICMSNDFFHRNIIFGTIVGSRSGTDLIKEGIVTIQFFQRFTGGQGTTENFTLVESKTNSIAHVFALAAVKKQLQHQTVLPFEDQILYHKNNITPPHYLKSENTVKKMFSLECVLKLPAEAKEENEKVCIDNLDNWPNHDEIDLDRSQYKAFTDGFTQGLTLIQGPPGTGKTMMALKLVETFLSNKSVWNKENMGPIILLSYTNHALDQFLEGITNMPVMRQALPGQIVRLGSKCKIESLDEFNLTHRRRQNKTDLKRNALSSLRETEVRHDKLANAFGIYLTRLVHEDFLRRCAKAIPGHIYEPLISDGCARPRGSTVLPEWLSVFSKDFVKFRDEKDEDKRNETVEEMEIENDYENDFFGIGTNVDDLATEVTLHNAESNKLPDPEIDVIDDKYLSKMDSSLSKKRRCDILTEVKMRIIGTKPMSLENECRIRNIWHLPIRDRWRLYKLWIHKILMSLKEEMTSAQQSYQENYNMYTETRQLEDITILKKATIVAMTTTRAARDQSILHAIKPKVMLIEEAAEVPDHHLVACLIPSLEHLILIGDHQQLRPSYNEFHTAMKYSLDVSIFERLIKAGLPFQQLQNQHRMRPEISCLLTPFIYKELNNDESVTAMDNIRGIRTNVFFLNHSHHESSDKDLKSHRNQHEVEFITQLYRYLRLQGYSSADITVLTTYKEQSRLLLYAIRNVEKEDVLIEPSHSNGNWTLMFGSDVDKSGNFANKQDKKSEGVKITTVDNFQGEENKIILLSLVRSNTKGSIGFLKEANRICVALSRAKAGMYVMGDCNMLKKRNELWKKILEKAEENGMLGDSLELSCERHPENKTKVSKASDFEKVQFGGCHRPCEFQRSCNHHCTRSCHADDSNHDKPCLSVCDKELCSLGHRCKDKCNNCTKECKPCPIIVPKELPQCGHTEKVPCHLKPEQFSCTHRCEKTLECGHRCQKKCGQECNTLKNCTELVKVRPDCGHCEIQIACHTKDNPICKIPCSAELGCGHKCQGTCYLCFQGKLHHPCGKIVEKRLLCGHTVKGKCSVSSHVCTKKAENFCGHLPSGSPCSADFDYCRYRCKWNCIKSYLYKYQCYTPCSEPCQRPQCNTRCKGKAKCGHLCDLLLCDSHAHWCHSCSDKGIDVGIRETATISPHRNPRFKNLEKCGCIFHVEAIDKYMEEEGSSSNVLKLIRCPSCEKPITDERYNYIWKTQRNLLGQAMQRASQKFRASAEIDNIREKISEVLTDKKEEYMFTRKRAQRGQSIYEELRIKSKRTSNYGVIETIFIQTNLLSVLCSLDTLIGTQIPLDTQTPRQKIQMLLDRLCDWLALDRSEFSIQEMREFSTLLKKVKFFIKYSLVEYKNPGTFRALVEEGDLLKDVDIIAKWKEMKEIPNLKSDVEDVENLEEMLVPSFDFQDHIKDPPALEGMWFKCKKNHIFPKPSSSSHKGPVSCVHCRLGTGNNLQIT